MSCCERISAVELFGDGSGLVCPTEISVSDVSVGVNRPYKGEKGIVERFWVQEEDLTGHLGVGDPDPELLDQYDVVVVLSELPVPFEFRDTPCSELSVDITVEQVEQAESRRCPRCASDMVATFKNGGCSRCGFYFDDEFVDDERREELDQIFDEFGEW